MVRIGVDENVAEELLKDFPRQVQLVRLPRVIATPVELDFWILPFYRKDTEAAFHQLRGVKVAQSLMAGVDWILPWLPRDIVLCDGRGIHDISASEWVMAAIMATMKWLPLYRDLQNKQQWKGFATVTDGFLGEDGPSKGQYKVLAEDLSGKTVLIVGYGSIGEAIEARLTPFGVSILRVARGARRQPPVSAISDIHALLPRADIVVLIVPLTDATRGLFGAPEIALMKHGALLVNAARGPVVVTDALVAALQEHLSLIHICPARSSSRPGNRRIPMLGHMRLIQRVPRPLLLRRRLRVRRCGVGRSLVPGCARRRAAGGHVRRRWNVRRRSARIRPLRTRP